MGGSEGSTGSSLSSKWLPDFDALLMAMPVSRVWIAALLCSLLFAVTYLATGRGRRWRRAKPIRVLRVLFSKRYTHHKSHSLDLLLLFANTKVVGLAIGWLILSGKAISIITLDALNGTFGPVAPTGLAPWAQACIGTVVIYLAYELGYWIDHTLSHRVPFLWEFHKVHHEAERLSPVTVYRVHPVDSLVFMNILAVTMGSASGLVHYSFGMARETVSFLNFDLVMVVLSFLLIELQHSHIWLSLRGWKGCLILSPAHHQIHHSTNPAHFNKNMGGCLAIFDWMFGTLHIPAEKREKLTFGVPSEVADPHTLQHGIVMPFVASGRHIWRGCRWGLCTLRNLIGRTAVPGGQKLPQA